MAKRKQDVKSQEAKWEKAAEAGEAKWEKTARKAEEAEKAGKVEKTEKAGKAEREPEERDRGMEKGWQKRKKEHRLVGSLVAKIAAFFLLALSGLAGVGGAILCVYIGEWGFYTEDYNTILMDSLNGECMETIFSVSHYLERGETQMAAEVCQNKNIYLELIWTDESGKENILWSTGRDYGTKLTMDRYMSFDLSEETGLVSLNHHILYEDEIYMFRICIDPDFTEEDEFWRVSELVSWMYERRYLFIGMTAAGIFLCIISFLFLMCSAGHHNDREGIVPGVLTGIPLDVLTLLFGGVVLIAVTFLLNVGWYGSVGLQIILLVAESAVLAVWLTIYFMDIAIRVKLGRGLRYSLIYMTGKWIWRGICFCCRGLAVMIRGIPGILLALGAYFCICFMEFLGVAMFVNSDEGIVLWGIEKIVLLFIVAYIALNCRKLLEASRALAGGQEDYEVDTSHMIGDFKEHGENLNSLGQGIAKAVAERMRSEHLKTELITNVSHDIKTPLTSIINYADLICEEAGVNSPAAQGTGLSAEPVEEPFSENKRIAEYAEVLLRQSRRLKKLLEDLVEASKATTGNLEVNLEPCEVGVLLSQAAGEYQQRMTEKELDLIVRQPEEPVKIMADGRRLWRVFDNLLNNICKYAQENSRVYLSLELKDGNAVITFRNMSKYPLDISAEELEERFVRGDKSRHMEGNGLGLSIARSLVDLQNGRMEITTDGDLFKVTLSFQLLVCKAVSA